MADRGVTESGFVAPAATELAAEVDAALKAGPLGASAGTDPDGSIPAASIAGQIRALVVDGFSALWDAMEAVWSGGDPTQAGDTAQDQVCALVGVKREPATHSEVVATCTGTPGTVLLKGRVATVLTAGTRFLSTADATLPGAGLTAWAPATLYAVGDRRTNVARAYECITAGISAGAGGPVTTAADITDNTCHWTYLGEGTGAVDVAFEAEDTGPLGAEARTLTGIGTPVSGWSSVMNLKAATIGQDEETDSALRLRREQEISASGNATLDAIRADVLALGAGSTDASKHVTACEVFQNETMLTNADGVPPKAVEVLVQRGTTDPDTELAETILGTVGAGIKTHGTVTVAVADSAGHLIDISYSRPVEQAIYVVVNATYDSTAGAFPPNGKALIASALLTRGKAFKIGQDVWASVLSAAVTDGPAAVDTAGAAIVPAPDGSVPVPGLLGVSSLFIGLAPAPGVSTPIPITIRQLATFAGTSPYAAGRLVINLTPGTP